MTQFLRRVRLRNWKSIADCDVSLGPVNFLVGPNGSGKSNFLDALRFVSDALSRSLDQALRERGGVNSVRRRSGGHPTHPTISLDFELQGRRGHYAFEIAASAEGGFRVKRERCVWERPDFVRVHYDFRDGVVEDYSPGRPPAAEPDRLLLVHASGDPAFRPIYDALSRMGFYSLDPQAMRMPQPPEAGDILARDGANAASVLDHLQKSAPGARDAIVEFLAAVVPGIEDVRRIPVAQLETLEFHQDVGTKRPHKFLASQMSDGTVRALGILIALLQVLRPGLSMPVVAIEEPEIALHPAATEVLVDALLQASRSTQLLVTSHSTDLLDHAAIDADSLLAVVAVDNATRIGRLEESAREALRSQLYSAGELLQMDQLQPAHVEGGPRQGDLFAVDG